MQLIVPNDAGADQSSHLPILHLVRILRDTLHISAPVDVVQDSAASSPPILPSSDTSSPVGYSSHIHETASYLTNHPDKSAFYPLWHQILAYWFPAIQGYDIRQDWDIPTYGELIPTLPIEFAVLQHGQPLVLLQIQGTMDSGNDISRQSARATACQLFDRAALWSGHPTLCVITAIGMRWNAFIRSTDMTSKEAQAVLGYDWFGEWSQDVASNVSWEVLGHCFRALKTSAETWTHP